MLVLYYVIRQARQLASPASQAMATAATPAFPTSKLSSTETHKTWASTGPRGNCPAVICYNLTWQATFLLSVVLSQGQTGGLVSSNLADKHPLPQPGSRRAGHWKEEAAGVESALCCGGACGSRGSGCTLVEYPVPSSDLESL